jgi:hypothetical protein
MAVVIPADLTIVTLRSDGKCQPQRFDLKQAANILNLASAIWQNRAGIMFSRGKCESVTEEMPAGMRADVVDDSGYHYLVSRYKAGRGVRVLFVDKTARPELGGQSRWEKRVCFVRWDPGEGALSRMLAHELGHLLELEHVDDRSVSGPGTESLQMSWRNNLMYSQALTPEAEVSDEQKAKALGSHLAKDFGG